MIIPYNSRPQPSVNIQPSLNPLPPSRPLIVLIQLNDYIPQELSTTPSTVCFPPNATPTKQSVQRAIQPLKTTVNTLRSLEDGSSVALLRESHVLIKRILAFHRYIVIDIPRQYIQTTPTYPPKSHKQPTKTAHTVSSHPLLPPIR